MSAWVGLCVGSQKDNHHRCPSMTHQKDVSVHVQYRIYFVLPAHELRLPSFSQVVCGYLGKPWNPSLPRVQSPMDSHLGAAVTSARSMKSAARSLPSMALGQVAGDCGRFCFRRLSGHRLGPQVETMASHLPGQPILGTCFDPQPANP